MIEGLLASSVLVICPHTDDEFGCAGTIARMVREGVEVRYLALSRCEESVPSGLPIDTLERECRRCVGTLGLPPSHIDVRRFRVRTFPAQRQEILELLVEYRNRLGPRTVLVPSCSDVHQDHEVVAREAFRAFKHSTVLGYELPQNLPNFPATAFVRLEAADLDSKCAALAQYGSQRFRRYASTEVIRSIATVRGMQSATEYAEAFEALRVVVR